MFEDSQRLARYWTVSEKELWKSLKCFSIIEITLLVETMAKNRKGEIIMFPEMRRKKQQLTQEESIEIFLKGSCGVLALLGNEDYPYAVPLSYVYEDHKIYFHGAKEGHKLDAIKKHHKASFCVIGQDQAVPEKFTTLYKSVIAFGKIRVVQDEKEKRSSIALLGRKYSPEFEEIMEKEIENDYDHFNMFALDIEHMTGKQCIELVQK